MAIKTTFADCISCGFPVSAQPGQTITCPMCGVSGTISGVEIPTSLFWGGLGLLAGYLIAKSKYIGGKLSRF